MRIQTIKKRQAEGKDRSILNNIKDIIHGEIPSKVSNTTISTGMVVNHEGYVKSLTISHEGIQDLEDLINEINGLESLTYLELSSDNISDARALSRLQNISGLELYDNNIDTLEPVCEISSLTYLGIASNNISDITGISRLNMLQSLDATKNKIEDVGQIGECESLEEVYLSSNGIDNLDEISKLESLNVLDIRKNKILYVPNKLLRRDIDLLWDYEDGAKGIYLKGNPLEYPPPDIITQGQDSIDDYIDSLRGEKRPLNEARILLVGDPGAGKTSVSRRLRNMEFNKDESQTHGINISQWRVGGAGAEYTDESSRMTAHVWDFGGQEIMHATHQFYLSKRSLYLVVLDGRREQEPEYWLKHVESFGGDSPILIILNKQDENPGHDVERSTLKRKYDNIVGFYETSCKTNKGIEYLRSDLMKALVGLGMRKTPFSKNWFNVKEELSGMVDDYISYDKYCSICKENGIYQPSERRTLLETLDQLGVALYYDEPDLKGTHILKPEWITKGVYAIINSQFVSENDGVLNRDDVPAILSSADTGNYEYPPGKDDYVINMMKRFELCYRFGRDSVLIPDLLPVQEPSGLPIDLSSPPDYVVDYDFLPNSIMPRFMVKRQNDIAEAWRSGVLLRDDKLKSNAIVKVDSAESQILLWVKGIDHQEYFNALRKTIRTINDDFEKIKPTEKVPLPDQPNYMVEYEELVGLERMDIREYVHGKTQSRYSVRELLNQIENPESRSISDSPNSADRVDVKVDINQNIETTSSSSSRSNAISLSYNEILENMSGELGRLMSLIESNVDDPEKLAQLKSRVDSATGAVDSTKVNAREDEIAYTAPMESIKSFITDIGDPDTEIGGILSGIKEGVQIAKNLASYYNQLAQWSGLPQVPDPFVSST